MKKYLLGGVIILTIMISAKSVYSQSIQEECAQKENFENTEEFNNAKIILYNAIINESESFEDIRKRIEFLYEDINSSELLYMNGLNYYKEGNIKKALKALKKNKKLVRSQKIDEYDPNSIIWKNLYDYSIVSLYRKEAEKHINSQKYDKAIPILKWFSECDSTPYSHYLLANCYYEQNALRKAEKHYGYAKKISSKKIEYLPLSFEIDTLLWKVRTLREIKQQQIAQVAGAILLVGAAATQTYMQSQNNSTNTKKVSTATAPSSSFNSTPSSSSNSNSQSNSDDDYYEYECQHCNGTGRVVVNRPLNVSTYGIKIEKVTCSECGKTYDKTSTVHKHETCSKCNGKGKIRERLR